MAVAVVTGAAGLIGGEAVRFFARQGFDIVGIDNDMRRVFLGPAASTVWHRQAHERSIKGYLHVDADIRDREAMAKVFARHVKDIAVVIHTAAQPSHDWAASDPMTDFTVNASATLVLLELARAHCPEAPFLYLSTNKVYGDTPNRLPLVERETRWELAPSHPFAAHGIDETMSIDHTTHSLFGVSKAAADVPYYVTDAARIRGETGWRPERSLAATLADIHKWLLDNRTALAPIFTAGS